MSGFSYTPRNVGQISQDWPVVPLKSCLTKLTNGFVGTSSTHQVQEGVNYIQGWNVRPGYIEFEKKTYVNQQFYEEKTNAQLQEDDVLVVQSGHIGTAAKVTADILPASCHALIIARPEKSKLLPDFLVQYLNSWIGQARQRGLHVGSSILHINTSELGDFLMPLPSIDEQQKIVEILSDCDTAIEHVEQQASLLIQVTNKSIKGLAENVGEPTKLSELCSPQQWQTISKSELLEEGIPVFGANGYIGYFSEANHHEDTIAVTCRGATSGEVSWVKGPAYITGNAMCLDDVDESQIFKRYLYYQLGLGGIKKIISGSAQPQIIGEDISRFTVFVPTLDYQNMALNVFEAQVSEINLLHKQLTLLKKQKRGLMQQLLTGKLRVKVAA